MNRVILYLILKNTIIHFNIIPVCLKIRLYRPNKQVGVSFVMPQRQKFDTNKHESDGLVVIFHPDVW